MLGAAGLYGIATASYVPGVDDMLPVVPMRLIAAAILGGAGMILVLAGVGLWRRRTWGWRLASFISVAGLVVGLIAVVDTVDHLGREFGASRPRDVATYGTLTAFFAASTWCLARMRPWFRRPTNRG